ncbi:unnamed protein product [Lathyrus oleraceus]
MRYRISYLMDEIWERAVETALEGEKDHASARTLTLDGAVKCVQGRLPPPSLLERFQNLQHLSIANVGVSSLEQFPRLRSLQKLNLSDNRIAGGLEFLVQAGLDSLRDLDLSNNRIQSIEDLAPLAQLKLVSLDLYECPVTRVKDYRSRVFGLIKSLKFLDKMDAEENERPESDEEEEDEEEEEEEEDPGSGEIDGGEEDRQFGMSNGHSEGVDGVVDADEEDESDADEEVTETSRGRVNGLNHQENGFHVAPAVGDDVEEEDDDDDDDDDDSGEEIDEEEGDDDDVVEVHEIDDSDDDDDGVEFDEDDDNDDDDEEVDNDEGDFAEPESTSGRLVSTEGEIDGHEQGEEDGDEDDNGETGEDEMGVEEEDDDDDDGEFEDDDEEEDCGAGYLVQPVGQAEALNDDAADIFEVENEDGEEEEEVDDEEDDDVQEVLPPASSHPKRKRDNDGEDDKEDEDEAALTKPSKKHH